MKITFVIPAYNAEKTIGGTLDSILHQTDDRYEIIVVNDGSTDRTDLICKEYLKENADKIRYIFQENRGLGGARNHGMELVETEYVSFIDSDDWLVPEYVEIVLKQLEQKEAEIVMTLPIVFHEGSRVIKDWYDKPLFEEIFQTDVEIINPQVDTRIYQFEVSQCRKILNMDFAREINFKFQEQIRWEDVFPHFYLLSKCKKCMGIRRVGFYYRIGNSQQITSMRGKERFDILPIFEDLMKYIQIEKRDDLEFPVMRVMVRFSIWCIRMADVDNRKRLVKELHRFFVKIPNHFFVSLKKGSRNNYSKADARQYQLFMIAIRYKIFNFIFFDYLYQDIGEKMVKKLLRAKERVA